MKLCKDCKHYVFSRLGKPQNNFDECARLKVMSPVDGELRYSNRPHQYCEVERATALPEYCGPEAQFFEAVSS